MGEASGAKRYPQRYPVHRVRRGNIEFVIYKNEWGYPFEIKRHLVNQQTKRAYVFYDFDIDRDGKDFMNAWRETRAWIRSQQQIDQRAYERYSSHHKN